MSNNVILTYNIRRSLFQLGVNNFYPPGTFQLKNGLQIHYLPVVNNLGDSIEYRAQQLNRLATNLIQKQSIESCHLLSFSLSGLDARLALSHLGLNKYVRSLLTVGTPHKGSKLAWLAQRQIFSDRKSDPIARLLGVGIRPFWEVTPQNMLHFNRSVKDAPDVKYYSIGGERLPNNMNIHLRQTGNYLRNKTEHNFVYQNDGIIGHDQSHWGEHLVNFEADHSQLVGLSRFTDYSMMIQLISEAFSAVQTTQI